jgi:hypothetical protein
MSVCGGWISLGKEEAWVVEVVNFVAKSPSCLNKQNTASSNVASMRCYGCFVIEAELCTLVCVIMLWCMWVCCAVHAMRALTSSCPCPAVVHDYLNDSIHLFLVDIIASKHNFKYYTIIISTWWYMMRIYMMTRAIILHALWGAYAATANRWLHGVHTYIHLMRHTYRGHKTYTQVRAYYLLRQQKKLH